LLDGALILCFARLREDDHGTPAEGGALGGPAAAVAGACALRRPGAHAARIHNPGCSPRSAPLASIVPAAPTLHLVVALLEAVSDRQACTWWASCSGRRRRNAATRSAAARIRNPGCSARSAPLASSMPATPALHLVDVLLEAVSDRQACTWWASCSGRHRRAVTTRCARGQDPQPELQRTIGAAGQQHAGRAGPHLVDILLEAVSDRKDAPGGDQLRPSQPHHTQNKPGIGGLHEICA